MRTATSQRVLGKPLHASPAMSRPSRTEALFIRSAAIVLLLTALAKVYSAFGSARILTALDPMIHLRYRHIMIGAGLLEIAIGIYLLRGRSVVPKLFVVLWLSTNFVVYRMANALLHFYVCPCLGAVGDALHLSRAQANFILEVIVLYLFLGSGLLLVALWSRCKESEPHAPTAPAAKTAVKAS